jgi:hypothetical protein
MRLTNLRVLLFLLCGLSISISHTNAQRQGEIASKEIQIQAILDSLNDVEYTELSPESKVYYWLNREWPEESSKNLVEEKQFVFKQCIDSALSIAQNINNTELETQVEIFRCTYLMARDSLLPLPKFPNTKNKELKLYWLSAYYNQVLKMDTGSVREPYILEMLKMVNDTTVNQYQRIVVADRLATSYFYPKGDYKKANELYSIGTESYLKNKFPSSPWKLTPVLAGEYIKPIEKVSRCLMNRGVCYEKMGDFSKAVYYYGLGAKNYKLLKDTFGLVWAYQSIVDGYVAQSDKENALTYIDSTLRIIHKSSQSILHSKAQQYSNLILNNFSLAFNPLISDRFLSLLALREPIFKETIDSASTEILYHAFFKLNYLALSNYINQNKKPLTEIEVYLKPVKSLDIDKYPPDFNLRLELLFQYNLLKAHQSISPELRRKHQDAYRDIFKKINREPYKSSAYYFAKPYLNDLEDYSFLLEMNGALFNFNQVVVSDQAARLTKDRFLAWKKLRRPDSALSYFMTYTTIKDSLVNAKNYIELTKADLELRTAESKREAYLLKTQSKLDRQRLLLSVIVSLSVIVIALLLVQRRRIISQKNAQVLGLKVNMEQERREVLETKNEEIQNELKEVIVHAMQHQNRNLELMEMVESLKEEAKSSKVFSKANEIKRKIKEYTAEESLFEIEQKAVKVYPKLYVYLEGKFSGKNKVPRLYCIMLVMNYSSDNIERVLQRSDKAIRSLRYRVRKKLQLAENEDLFEHLISHTGK